MPRLETMIYAPDLFTLVISEGLRNQNITNFTPDWKLWHLRFQHTSGDDCYK